MKFDLLIQGGKLVIPKQGIVIEPLSPLKDFHLN